MSRKITIVLLIVCAICVSSISQTAASQSFPSEELLFTSLDIGQTRLQPIGKWNIITDETTYLETTTEDSRFPYRWSPSGKWLVVVNSLRKASGHRHNYCVLDRAFREQSCMNEYNGADALSKIRMVSWSPDESKLYFVQAPGDGSWRFVEADVLSGKTLRVLTSSTQVKSLGMALTWSSDLKLLLNNSQLISLAEPTQSHPPVVKTLGSAGLLEVSPSALGAVKNKVEGAFELCGYSPRGKYITAVDVERVYGGSEENPFFLIFDAQGRLLKQLDKKDGIVPDCPAWGHDDEYFMYWDAAISASGDTRFTRTNIVRFDIKTLTQVAVYNNSVLPMVGELVPSPDGKWIAFLTSNIHPRNLIGLIDSNDKIRYFGKPEHHYGIPVWIPPLIEK